MERGDTLWQVSETVMASARSDLERQQKFFLFRLSPIIPLIYISQSVVWLWDFFFLIDPFTCPTAVPALGIISDNSDIEVNANNIVHKFHFSGGRCRNVSNHASYCYSSIACVRKPHHGFCSSVNDCNCSAVRSKKRNVQTFHVMTILKNAIRWQQVSSLSMAFFHLLN